LILTGLCLVATSAGVARAGDAARVHGAGIQVQSVSQLDSRLLEFQLLTPDVEGATGVRVLLPAGYRENQRRYPVLYLLHGAINNYKAWTDQGDAEALTAKRKLIVAMPDSGTHDGYTDWYNGGQGGPPAWEHYHLSGLIPFIDHRFRTIADRGGRAVAGLSMGGGGAMIYAAHRPDLFTAAASFSGAVNLTNPAIVAIADPAARGSYVDQRLRWEADDPVRMAGNLKGLKLVLRTGNGMPGGPFDDRTTVDPVEFVVHQSNLTLHQRLEKLGIAHLWDDYGPGTHTWPYWRRGLAQTLPILMRRFRQRTPPPARVTYTSDRAGYDIYGWSVRIKRTAAEFSTLKGAGRKGFALTGSGKATVATAPILSACRSYRVKIDDATGKRRIKRATDRRGRLRLRLDLGPPNANQQYSAADLAAGHQSVTAKVGLRPKGKGRCGHRA
jgi:S-formylglutathione hydrolase FrmB